jgi:hypothetical protein
MSKKPKIEDLPAIEKAISDKYGKEAIANPLANWSEEKEKEYLVQLKEFESKEKKEEMPKSKLFNQERVCPECKTYSFSIKDDLYMLKFNMCYRCHLKKERFDLVDRNENKNTNS